MKDINKSRNIEKAKIRENAEGEREKERERYIGPHLLGLASVLRFRCITFCDASAA